MVTAAARQPLGGSEPESADLEVRKSAIEGLGVHALRSFSPGEQIHVVNVVREITHEAPLRPERGERADHCDYPAGKVVLLGAPDRYINHSCDPNTWVRYDAAETCLVARRVINIGDELTCDYAINVTGGATWPCRCGDRRCRGQVVGDYFQLPAALQHEYAIFLAPWFKVQHAAELRARGILA